jgi:hypothetical protein
VYIVSFNCCLSRLTLSCRNVLAIAGMFGQNCCSRPYYYKSQSFSNNHTGYYTVYGVTKKGVSMVGFYIPEVDKVVVWRFLPPQSDLSSVVDLPTFLHANA